MLKPSPGRDRFPPVGGKCRAATKGGAGGAQRRMRAQTGSIFPQRRAFAESGAANAVFRYDPSGEKANLENPQIFQICEIINNSSAEYAQSATTTTAASGGNREELLGQRPARRECRPRHDADAGCRNPIAEAISNRLFAARIVRHFHFFTPKS